MNPAFGLGVTAWAQNCEQLVIFSEASLNGLQRFAPRRPCQRGPFRRDFLEFLQASFQECLEIDTAVRGEAHEELPVCDERQKLLVVALEGPKSGKIRGFIPHTQLFGPATAVLHYDTVA